MPDYDLYNYALVPVGGSSTRRCILGTRQYRLVPASREPEGISTLHFHLINRMRFVGFGKILIKEEHCK